MPDCVVCGVHLERLLCQLQHSARLLARLQDCAEVIMDIFEPVTKKDNGEAQGTVATEECGIHLSL